MQGGWRGPPLCITYFFIDRLCEIFENKHIRWGHLKRLRGSWVKGSRLFLVGPEIRTGPDE